MSSGTFSKQNSSPGPTRRTRTRNEYNENNPQHNANHRSLSGKFRNLFRKSSSSPNRTTNNTERPPLAPARQRSQSPQVKSASTEAPHLRAPLVSWPFGKKRAKSPATTNGKTKTKGGRKTKKTTVPPLEISNPIYQQEYQTSIHGQNFVPRTPELSHGSTGRTHSSSNYETTTKGFRDYMVIDNTKPSQQVIVHDADIITPPPYSSNRSRSPSLSHNRLPDTTIQYPYHNDISSSPRSDIEVFHTPKHRHKVDDTPSLTAIQTLVDKTPSRPQTSNYSPSKQRRKVNETQSFVTDQSLVENTPILFPTITQSPKSTMHSNQWKSMSSSSLNNNEMRSTASSSMDVDVPKLNEPFVPLGHTSNTEKSKRTNSQYRLDETYNSLSTMNNVVQPHRSYTSTHSSFPDAEIMHSNSLTSLQPDTTNSKVLILIDDNKILMFLLVPKYPGLSAIVHYHIRPSSIYYNEYPSITTSPQRIKRFDASTTTLNDNDQGQQWYNTLNSGSPSSPSCIHHHDGYIRPLTPQKPSLQTDTNACRVDTDDSHGRRPLTPSRTSYYDSSEIPVIYRSSKTVYTKDKHSYVDGGELRTWSIQDNNDIDIDINRNPSTSIQIECICNDYDIVLPTITNEYQNNSRIHEPKINHNDVQEENYVVSYEYEKQYPYDEQQYSNRYSHNYYNDKNSSFTRPSTIIEREKIYDQSTRSYQTTERRQEPINGITHVENSEASLRHYILKHSNSYDGLGILISADNKTGLNPRIRDIEPGSPAYQIGLRKNDRIIYINGINVENLEFSDVLILIKEGLHNNNLQLSVINESTNF
ncbi:unnamed protein product [Rotaria sp. Silwood1]|nr:unnamed protein product [Rotaria sp. Silwood1]CAF0929139.1 unnamed protein product [Rotaria sp. Silwood1]CAF3372070.1 unnamed protein product [Rotaria sp. Silwood1]CAF4644278.1 unnamed protein product [Rotaria sp. Silwood1]